MKNTNISISTGDLPKSSFRHVLKTLKIQTGGEKKRRPQDEWSGEKKRKKEIYSFCLFVFWKGF